MIHPALFEQVNTELVRLKLLEGDVRIGSMHFDETDGHLESVFLESGLHALANFYGVETTPCGAMSQCRIGDVTYCQPLTDTDASDTKKWTEDMAIVYAHNEMNQILLFDSAGEAADWLRKATKLSESEIQAAIKRPVYTGGSYSTVADI